MDSLEKNEYIIRSSIIIIVIVIIDNKYLNNYDKIFYISTIITNSIRKLNPKRHLFFTYFIFLSLYIIFIFYIKFFSIFQNFMKNSISYSFIPNFFYLYPLKNTKFFFFEILHLKNFLQT